MIKGTMIADDFIINNFDFGRQIHFDRLDNKQVKQTRNPTDLED
ncbi:MAG: hypothetical protein ACFFDT_21040 [Candidatus Hodarchaeota archaeon]